ncbi:MAG: hypothetical protein AAFV25_25295, partial [Bacteroidota bacterium]
VFSAGTEAVYKQASNSKLKTDKRRIVIILLIQILLTASKREQAKGTKFQNAPLQNFGIWHSYGYTG